MVGCWAPTSGYAGPELRDQAGGQGAPRTFEWPTPIDMPGEKNALETITLLKDTLEDTGEAEFG